MPQYSVSLVKRTPNQSTAPTFDEVAPVTAEGLSWADILNAEDEASASTQPENLPTAAKDAIREQLSDLVYNPANDTFEAVDPPGLELWIWRGPLLVPGSGPIVGYQFQGETMSFNVRGPEYYLRYMYVDSDITHTDNDQYDIGKGLVDQWRTLDYGDFGIDTSGIGTSGTTRTRSYPKGDKVFDRLVELADVNGGFDWWVEDRELNFAAEKGSATDVVLDRRNITNAQINVAVSAGRIASEALALNSEDPPLDSESSNTDLRQSFGRTGVVAAFDGVVEQSTLDNYAVRLRDERSTPQVVAQPEAIPVAGASAVDFDSGDRVDFAFDPGIGLLVFRRRVQAKRVVVAADGNETLNVEFL